MNNFDRLCEQLRKANIPFCQLGNDAVFIYPDKANKICMSVYMDTPLYRWYKRTTNAIESGATENFQNVLVRLINFYADYENTT